MEKTGYIIILCLLISFSWSDQLTQTIIFDYDDLQFEKIADYDLVFYKGYGNLHETGNPQLPARSAYVAIPSGARVTGVEIISMQQEYLPGSYFIFPSQEPRPINQINVMNALVEPNLAIYNSNNPYPDKTIEFVNQADLAGQVLAQIRIHPLQYIPTEKTLVLNTQIEFTIQYTMDGTQPEKMKCMSEKTKSVYEQMIEAMVLNPELVRIEPESPMYDSAIIDTVQWLNGYDHVIITCDSLKSSFADLVFWHKRKGIPDTVVTTEYIYDHYTGGPEEQIRNFIWDVHNRWGTIWFLLGGDVEIIPIKIKSFAYWDVPGDMYYSDYDDDLICEVFVARAPIQNSNEVDIFIDKVLKYEKDPPLIEYPTTAFLMGFDADSFTHDEEMKEYINTEYIPEYFTVAKVYDSHTGNHRTDCINYLNEGYNLVNHADHGGHDFMGTGHFNHEWGIYSSDVDDLINGDRQSIIYSVGCNVVQFDSTKSQNSSLVSLELPQGPLPLGDVDCIAEHFMLNTDGGAVAFTGNTRYGWYFPGDMFSCSNLYDIEWWRSLFDYNMYHLGQTLADSKNRNPPEYWAEEFVFWELLTLGAPEMPIWTDTPSYIFVAHPYVIPMGYQSITLTVTNQNDPVPNALVCLWKGSEVYKHGLTDTLGQKTFIINPRTTGGIYVTATAQNCLPYEGYCLVYNSP